jgi:hypothetical protein
VGLFQILTPEVRQKILDGRTVHLEKAAEHLAGIHEHFSLDTYARETTRFLQKQIDVELTWRVIQCNCLRPTSITEPRLL